MGGNKDGRDNFSAFVRKASRENRVLYVNKRNASKKSPVVRYLDSLNKSTFDENISYYKDSVKELKKKRGLNQGM